MSDSSVHSISARDRDSPKAGATSATTALPCRHRFFRGTAAAARQCARYPFRATIVIAPETTATIPAYAAARPTYRYLVVHRRGLGEDFLPSRLARYRSP